MDATLLLLNTSPKPKLSTHNPIHDPLHSLLQTSTPNSIDLSFDRIIESTLDKHDVINRALLLGSAITEAANRSARRLASAHNSISWALPTDLTIKVFAYLDTHSVCQVAATCTLFRKCAADPLCYSFIDLTMPVQKVNNLVVSTMIQRARNLLKSLKLGIVPVPSKYKRIYYGRNKSVLMEIKTPDDKKTNVLSRSCLAPLYSDGGVKGALLRQLQLFNIERIDDVSLAPALSACPSLLDLVIVGLTVELGNTLESVSTSCPLIERLFFQSSNTGRDDSLKTSTCDDLVTNCKNLFSLALRGFKLPDYKIHILVKGFRKLKRVDFSTSYSISGEFLRHLGGGLLEVLVLRDCMHLREAEVSRFLSSVHAGRFKHLRHIDVSNREGLASDVDVDWNRRCLTPNFACLGELLEGRPNLRVVAEYPAEGGFVEDRVISLVEEAMISEYDTPSLTSSRTYDGYCVSSTSEGSYNSDQSSGSEENPAFIHSNREGSSDEMGYL